MRGAAAPGAVAARLAAQAAEGLIPVSANSKRRIREHTLRLSTPLPPNINIDVKCRVDRRAK